ncbi:AAA domain-containing protein [Maribacter spongiicola]|uniref:AAA domain-containing protein n=1 Tax=Maribacter spongiicola TaxID=1206753 RepID=A0A4V3ERV7_9FLAO|nr:AAA domain-containing protein [Maribacter spongiicola]TDT46943.1 AAA domain-containing protein [Maribacter spongiicola]
MDNEKWLKYWRKCLIDSLKNDIKITEQKHFEIKNFDINNSSIYDIERINELINYEEYLLNTRNGVLKDDIDNWIKLDNILVLIAPFKLIQIEQYRANNRNKFPFWYYANVNRQGVLWVPEEIAPFYQRKYLEPQADESTEFIFSSVDKINQQNNVKREDLDTYQRYIDYIKTNFKKVADYNISDYRCYNHKKLNDAVVILSDIQIGAAQSIVDLYDKILKNKEQPELLKAFINIENNRAIKPLQVEEFTSANHLHIGQMGYEFPISISQRKSLYTLLNSDDNVFAINGPPGTGKTTLLQSIVANKIVETAIEGGNPAVILACSTNNQAVTNIIESFSKSNTKDGPLRGRWLPDVDGYATYLPASGKNEDQLRGINYKKLVGGGLFGDIENEEFVGRALDFYLVKSETYFGENLNIPDTLLKLQSEIKEIKYTLIHSKEKWENYLKGESLFKSLKVDEEQKFFSDNFLSADQLRDLARSLQKSEHAILSYFNSESIFRKLFCILGIKSSLRSRQNELNIILRDSILENRIKDYSKNSLLEQCNATIKTVRKITKLTTDWESFKERNDLTGNPPRNKEEYWDLEMLKIRNKVAPNCFYDELDVSIRHKAFQLAIHYWEGRYLQRLESDLRDPNFTKKGKSTVISRWQRHAMLTPCFVSTFYMAPKFFSYYKFLQKDNNGKAVFDNPALFNFVDLLLVDESGQVTPEVGTAIFSLAKKAVVVGDVKQIEPVWNISNKIDVGNLKNSQLIVDYDDEIYETLFDPKGYLASTGSIMKMAQNASSFKEPELEEKGVILQEHRRCYNEIINYCNELAYNGLLIPLKGRSGNDLLFPPMYCIHVESNSVTNNTSRQNYQEAEELVKWLLLNRNRIEGKYEMKVEEAVGVITPFTGQKNVLRSLLKQNGINTSIMKLGTVHALQGAERPIILFSMVYGDGDSGTMFFDRDNKPNMLNVAVSRAKDNFIVFANTKILDKSSKSPSGILANHLKYEDNSLS